MTYNPFSKKRTLTDNRSLATKTELRKRLLADMGITDAYVLDTCAGAGEIWAAMADHVNVKQWIRCDLKPRQHGTLALSAQQAIQNLPLDTFNVIDIDPYGEPWEPYMALLARLRKPTAVFVTRGHVGWSRLSHATVAFVGLPDEWFMDLPRTPQLCQHAADLLLQRTWDFADILHSYMVRMRRVDYFALGLAPVPKDQRGSKRFIALDH